MTSRSMGELLLDEIAATCVVEDGRSVEHWAGAQAQRVADRLNRCRVPSAPLQPVVFWAERVTAFTAPGPYLFISRELLQRLPHDAAVAFVLAHEMAHHDLGHLGATEKQASAPRWAWRAIVKLSRSPEDEADADRYSLQLCLQAGYQSTECLEAFRILTSHSIDWGDLEGVFGNDDAPFDHALGHRQWLRRWWWQRSRGYQCLLERRTRLEAMLAQSAPATAVASYRGHGIVGQVVRCAGCERVRVGQAGDLCTACLRRAHFDRRLERAVREERRSTLVEDWRWGLPVLLMVIALLVAIGSCGQKYGYWLPAP